MIFEGQKEGEKGRFVSELMKKWDIDTMKNVMCIVLKIL